MNQPPFLYGGPAGAALNRTQQHFNFIQRFNSVNKTSREHHSIHVCKTVLSVNFKLLLNESVFGKFELSSITIPTIKGGVLRSQSEHTL